MLEELHNFFALNPLTVEVWKNDFIECNNTFQGIKITKGWWMKNSLFLRKYIGLGFYRF